MSDWLRDLAAKATPGPWTLDFPGMIVAAPSGVVLEAEPWDYTLDNEADYRLIALAPDLARVAADLADTLRKVGEHAFSHSGRDGSDVLLSALYRIGEKCEESLAAFDALAPKDAA